MSRRSLILFFLIFFIAKLAISFDYTKSLFCRNPEIRSGKLTAFTGDAFSYTGAMENYILKGEYYFEVNGKKVYAGRAPHYSIPYYLLRFGFSKSQSLDLFVVLQLFLESLAFFLVSRIVFDLTKSKLVFYFSLLFSAVSFFYLHYTVIPITDSPASSLLFISFWFLYNYLEAGKLNFADWICFSVLLAVATILRPYFGLIFILVMLFVLLRAQPGFMNLVRHGFVYSIVLLFLLLPWIIRNYSKFGRVFLFQQDQYAGYEIGKELELTRKMLSAIGEDASTMWDKTTAASFFSRTEYKESAWKVPGYIKADSVLNANFLGLRELSIDSVDDKIQSIQYSSYYQAFIDRYKSAYAFKYYFLNYVARIKKFLVHSGSYYYAYDPNSNCSDRKSYYFKIIQSLLYHLCLIPGFIGLLTLARTKEHGLIFLIPAFSLLLTFPVILGVIEWRYFLPFYFFNQVGLFILFHKGLSLFKLKT